MKSWLYPGAKVICVNAAPFEQHLTVGAEYTIAVVEENALGAEGVWVGLVEVNFPAYVYHVHWRADRFRPVQRRSTETGMAILKQIAAKPPKRLIKETV